jgi:riboflavin synthase
MFTGITTDIGEVIEVETAGDRRLTIACGYPAQSLTTGGSIACSGICLTVVDVAKLTGGRAAFAVEASAETLKRTTLSRWSVGTKINLERALRAGEELGGHLVSGHVDGIARILSIRPEGDSKRFSFLAPKGLARLTAPKGSICLDGTSLTVNEVSDDRFEVNIIPHTLKVTTWGLAREGEAVNVEIDMLARYVARLLESRS